MLIWQLILIQMATFVVIILFLRWLLYSHITRALRRLQNLNRENLEKEKALKEELERAKREAKRVIEEGLKEAENMKSQAKEEAEKDMEDMRTKAKKEAKRLVSEAARDCQRKETELAFQMREKAIYLATDMIRYIFSEKSHQDLHGHLIEELITEIEKLAEKEIKTQGNKAEVICASALQESQRKRLARVLSSKLKKDVKLAERIDEEIIAGLIIRMGGFVIDGSMKNKFKKILPLMKEKLKESKEESESQGK